MEKVDTLVVDKTGTLTEGKPARDAVVAAQGFTRTRSCGLRPASSGQRTPAGRGHRRGRPRREAVARRSTDFDVA